MVELEFKYQVEEFPDISPILELTDKKRIIDTYFDTCTYELISKGIFIRLRGDKIDIKYLISEKENCACNEFSFSQKDFNPENESLIAVLDTINLQFSKGNFQDFLFENRLEPLLKIDKIRCEYTCDDVTVCLDEVDGLGKYVEIEAMFNELSDIEIAKIKLEDLISKIIFFNGSYFKENTGYVELYLKKYNLLAYECCLFKG